MRRLSSRFKLKDDNLIRLMRAFILLFIISFCIHVFAEDVEVTLVDGTKIKGILVGYEDGNYIIRTEFDTRLIPDAKVMDVNLLKEIEPVKPEQLDYKTLRFLVEENVAKVYPIIRKRIKKETRPKWLALYKYATEKYIKDILLDRGSFDELMFLIMEYRKNFEAHLQHLLKDIAEKVYVKLNKEPENHFFIKVAIYCLRNCHALVKETWCKLLEKPIDKLLQKADSESLELARKICNEIIVFSTNKKPIKKKNLLACLKLAKLYFGQKSYHKALSSANEALAIDPKNKEAKKLYKTIDNTIAFEELKKKLPLLSDREKLPVLKKFIDEMDDPKYRDIARRWMSEITSRLARVIEQRPTPYEELKTYFPLKEGQYYVYKERGRVTKQTLIVKKVETKEDVIEISVIKKEIYKYGETKIPIKYEITTEGLYEAGIFRRKPLIMFPIEVGNEWTWQEGDIKYRRKIVDKRGVTTVPAGKFTNCLVIEYETKFRQYKVVSRNYYAKGVGLVKVEYLDPAYEKYIIELYEYGTLQTD
jgi:hypothetical protein